MKRITLFAFVALFFISNGIAQSIETLQSQPSFVAIIVSDIDSSMQWYSETFRLKDSDFINMPSRGLKQANLKNENLHLELIELNSALTPTELLRDKPPKSRITGLFKFGLKTTEFDQWIMHFEKNKVKFNGKVVKDKNGDRTVIVLDPDGNRIQLFEKTWDEEQEKIKTLFENSYLPVVYGNGDPDLLDKAFHPEFNMYVYYQGRFYKRTYAEWKEKLKENIGKDNSEYSFLFESIDITGGTAMMKLIIYSDGQLKYTDYLTLYKMEPGWQVFTKLFTIH